MERGAAVLKQSPLPGLLVALATGFPERGVGSTYSCYRFLGFRKDDGVDDVDDTVFSEHVGFHHLGGSDHDSRILHLDAYVFAVYSFGLHGFDIGGHDFAGDDVVGEDRHQLVTVLRLEETFDRAGRQLLKGFVCRGKDREWTITLEGFHETGGLDCSHQSLEATCFHRDCDNVFVVADTGFFVVTGAVTAVGHGADGGHEADCNSRDEEFHRFV